MKIETALTAFCMTTVLIIVGLVMLTATQLKLTNPVIVGSYLGIPTQGQIFRENIEITFVDVDPDEPFCYQNGVKACKRANAGLNFIQCADRVALDCGLPHVELVQCILPPGFELKYMEKRECRYGVIDECKARCSVGQQQDCVERSKSRCENIGGRFTYIREQTRLRAYPQAQLVTR